MNPLQAILDALSAIDNIRGSITDVLHAIGPILEEILGLGRELSPDEVASLNRRVHERLRAAELIEGVDL